MVLSASTVALVSITMTVLMVAAMLYLVWETLDSDIHTPSPDDEQPALDDADEGAADDEPQGELPDGSSA